MMGNGNIIMEDSHLEIRYSFTTRISAKINTTKWDLNIGSIFRFTTA
ncbi:hypothetical protein EVA_19876 [gut metagenome]|uniref:Uncharacterized protein n=1 Tax=gut metagenome TaxID=749906 RepID=J9FAT0_9ZZZZ